MTESHGSVPGGFSPLSILSVAQADLIQLGEEVVWYVLFIIILSAQQKLNPLRGSICDTAFQSLQLTTKLSSKGHMPKIGS